MADDATDTPTDDAASVDAPEAPDETTADEAADAAEPAAATDAGGPADDGDPAEGATATTAAAAKADVPAKADAAAKPKAKPPVARRTVQSRRVTPKGGPTKAAATPKDAPLATSKARDAKKTAEVVDRAVHQPLPPAAYAKGPSPWWVPALMFALLIIGALLIVANYAGAFGDPDNLYLVLGLGFILGGIITATQYR
jgi:hypothetical protein